MVVETRTPIGKMGARPTQMARRRCTRRQGAFNAREDPGAAGRRVRTDVSLNRHARIATSERRQIRFHAGQDKGRSHSRKPLHGVWILLDQANQ